MGVDVALVLIVSGVLVGFVNSLAGGASVISFAVFTALGLPVAAANATNRIAVLAQNVTSTAVFRGGGAMPCGTGIRLAIPAVIGNVAGSLVAVRIDENTLNVCLGVVTVLVLVAMCLERRSKARHGCDRPAQLHWWHYGVFLVIGFYSGFIYIGVGYLIISAALLALRTDSLRANALKVFILMLSTPFSLAVFIYEGGIDYRFGLLHAAGNIVGAYFATRFAVKWGAGFVRVFMSITVLAVLADLTGLISLERIVSALLGTA